MARKGDLRRGAGVLDWPCIVFVVNSEKSVAFPFHDPPKDNTSQRVDLLPLLQTKVSGQIESVQRVLASID